MELTEREMTLIGMALDGAIEDLSSDPSEHEEDQMISNQYYLEIKALREKFPTLEV